MTDFFVPKNVWTCVCGCLCLSVCESRIHISGVFLWMYLNNACASVLGLVCANVHVTVQVLLRMPLGVCNAVGWVPPERVTRKRDHWRATNFLAQKRFEYFFICGRKESYGSENNNKWSTAPLFFLPSLSLSISSSLTLSDLIPTLYLHSSVAAESISRDASLQEKKGIFHCCLFSLCRSHRTQPTQSWWNWDWFVTMNNLTDNYM